MPDGISPDGIELTRAELAGILTFDYQLILMRASVAIYSTLDRAAVEAAMLTPIDDLQTHLEQCIRAVGKGVPVAVLPDGPLSIPYVVG